MPAMSNLKTSHVSVPAATQPGIRPQGTRIYCNSLRFGSSPTQSNPPCTGGLPDCVIRRTHKTVCFAGPMWCRNHMGCGDPTGEAERVGHPVYTCQMGNLKWKLCWVESLGNIACPSEGACPNSLVAHGCRPKHQVIAAHS